MENLCHVQQLYCKYKEGVFSKLLKEESEARYDLRRKFATDLLEDKKIVEKKRISLKVVSGSCTKRDEKKKIKKSQPRRKCDKYKSALHPRKRPRRDEPDLIVLHHSC